MAENEDKNHRPLTLEMLADYNQQVLLPAMDERFVVKQEFNQFRDKNLTAQDEILKKLDLLLDEKGVRQYQEKKEKNYGLL